MDMHLLAYILAGLLIVGGVIGTAVLLPGVPLVFLGMLLAAWVDGFRVIPVWVVVVLAVLSVLALAIDFVASLLGAKRVGASRFAIFGAFAGTIAGLFFGLPGLVLGPFLGALGGELVHSRDPEHATRVGIGTWVGMVAGTLFKLVLVFAMLGIFLSAIAMH